MVARTFSIRSDLAKLTCRQQQQQQRQQRGITKEHKEHNLKETWKKRRLDHAVGLSKQSRRARSKQDTNESRKHLIMPSLPLSNPARPPKANQKDADKAETNEDITRTPAQNAQLPFPSPFFVKKSFRLARTVVIILLDNCMCRHAACHSGTEAARIYQPKSACVEKTKQSRSGQKKQYA